jgi:hypothetical protein
MAQDELHRIADELETLQGQLREDQMTVLEDAAAIRSGQQPADLVGGFRVVASTPAYLSKLTDLVADLVAALRERGVTGP